MCERSFSMMAAALSAVFADEKTAQKTGIHRGDRQHSYDNVMVYS
jgi:hypothetical protein